MGVIFLFIVKEPIPKPLKEPPILPESRPDPELVEEGNFISASFNKAILMSQLFIHEFRTNSALPVCFFGVVIITVVYIVNNTFLLLWITTYVDEGVLLSDE
mmetsp:Transcript_41273/g.30345  ORF Transcript_41273/g.30345 Transcript_41273/m.30345 type:complete len:102 (-) Transcript_41273:502-807(-)